MRPPFRRLIRFAVLAGLAAAAGRGAQPQRPLPTLQGEGEVVMLPPLIVEEKTMPLKWRYYRMDGREVLAACPENLAIEIVERMRQLDTVLGTLLPERFRERSSLPETLVLIDQAKAPATARDVVASAAKWSRTQPARYLPNVRLLDRDSAVTLGVVAGKASDFKYSEERIVFQIERRAPRLPEWYIAGMSEFYRRLAFNERTVVTTPALLSPMAEDALLSHDPHFPRRLLPIKEMLGYRLGADPTAERERIWRAQCTAFIYWALVDQNGARRNALWSFVDRLEKEPPSDALFREHFGIGYADMRDQLSDYLAEAVKVQPTTPFPTQPGRAASRIVFRDASELEIARIRGQLERLEAASVRRRAPEHADRYLEQARRTLYDAYDRGVRDPDLTGILGLTELEAGNTETARPLLEAAAAGGVKRPAVLLAVAHQRYAALGRAAGDRAGAIGGGRKLTAEEVETVAGPLLAAHAQEPPLLDTYALLSEVVSRGPAVPTAAQLTALHEGARSFPEVSQLVAFVIKAHRTSEQPAAAAVLAELGLRRAADAEGRERIERAMGGAGGESR